MTVQDSAAAHGTREAADGAEAPPVLVARDGAVARITLNRPTQFNALSGAMMDALQQAFDELAADETVRAVVIAAAGKAFCAGHDLREMRAAPSTGYYQALFGQCGRLMTTILRMPQPVIARVHGVATAAGCQLVAACDLAVAAENARFAVSGINLGLFCSTPAVALSRNVGRKQAFEMLVTGQFIDAPTALARGLVNRVVPADELDAAIDALLAQIVVKPREAIALGKDLFYRQLEMGVEGAYQLAVQTMACNMMEASALEGVQAFIDKRPPQWG